MGEQVMNFTEVASYYASLGWQVFPVHSTEGGVCTCTNGTACKNPGKHPRIPNGLNGASDKTWRIKTWGGKWSEANVGIRTGAASGFFVLDVDVKGGGPKTLKKLKKGKDWWDTVTCKTGGGGSHYYFLMPEGKKIRSRVGVFDGIDVRGDGGYVIAPPSQHHTGNLYMWELAPDEQSMEPAPDWLIEKVAEEVEAQKEVGEVRPAPSTPSAEHLPIKTEIELASALEWIDAGPRDDWRDVGFALRSYGNKGYDIWTEWSKGSDKYDDETQQKQWKSFLSAEAHRDGVSIASLFFKAKNNGWNNLVVADAAADVQEDESRETVLTPRRPFPTELLDVPGIIGDVTEWIVSSAHRPLPPLALANTIAAMGAIFGRRYATPTDGRTCLYFVGLAGTGAGKDHSRNQIKKLFAHAGLANYIGGEAFASGTGLLSALKRQPSCLFQLDEFGHMMEFMGNIAASGSLADLISNLLKMYTSCHSVFHGKEYANLDGKLPRSDLVEPNPCLFATATGETFYPHIGTKRVVDGYLNRLIIIDCGADRPQRQSFDPTLSVPSKEMIARLKEVEFIARTRCEEGDIAAVEDSGLASKCLPVPATVKAQCVMGAASQVEEHEMKVRTSLGLEGLWSRYVENAWRLALVRACSRNPADPLIEEEDANWGVSFIDWSVRTLELQFRDAVSENKVEDSVKRLLTVIRKAGKGGIAKRVLTRRTQYLRQHERNDYLNTLVEGGQVTRNVQGRAVYFVAV